MKVLQDLVPGCNKVHVELPYGFKICAVILSVLNYHVLSTLRILFFSQRKLLLETLIFFSICQVIGKASVLDEIINYIQSLQCQVEVCGFLSHVKLSCICGIC